MITKTINQALHKMKNHSKNCKNRSKSPLSCQNKNLETCRFEIKKSNKNFFSNRDNYSPIGVNRNKENFEIKSSNNKSEKNKNCREKLKNYFEDSQKTIFLDKNKFSEKNKSRQSSFISKNQVNLISNNNSSIEIENLKVNLDANYNHLENIISNIETIKFLKKHFLLTQNDRKPICKSWDKIPLYFFIKLLINEFPDVFNIDHDNHEAIIQPIKEKLVLMLKKTNEIEDFLSLEKLNLHTQKTGLLGLIISCLRELNEEENGKFEQLLLNYPISNEINKAKIPNNVNNNIFLNEEKNYQDYQNLENLENFKNILEEFLENLYSEFEKEFLKKINLQMRKLVVKEQNLNKLHNIVSEKISNNFNLLQMEGIFKKKLSEKRDSELLLKKKIEELEDLLVQKDYFIQNLKNENDYLNQNVKSLQEKTEKYHNQLFDISSSHLLTNPNNTQGDNNTCDYCEKCYSSVGSPASISPLRNIEVKMNCSPFHNNSQKNQTPTIKIQENFDLFGKTVFKLICSTNEFIKFQHSSTKEINFNHNVMRDFLSNQLEFLPLINCSEIVGSNEVNEYFELVWNFSLGWLFKLKKDTSLDIKNITILDKMPNFWIKFNENKKRKFEFKQNYEKTNILDNFSNEFFIKDSLINKEIIYILQNNLELLEKNEKIYLKNEFFGSENHLKLLLSKLYIKMFLLFYSSEIDHLIYAIKQIGNDINFFEKHNLRIEKTTDVNVFLIEKQIIFAVLNALFRANSMNKISNEEKNLFILNCFEFLLNIKVGKNEYMEYIKQVSSIRNIELLTEILETNKNIDIHKKIITMLKNVSFSITIKGFLKN